MRGRKWDKKSIVFRLTSYVIILIIVQAFLLTATLIAGGVLSQGQKNAYQSFYEKVNNRKDYIQMEMKNRWTKMDPYVAQMSRSISSNEDTELFFSAAVQDLIAVLRTTKATGAFVILEDSNAKESGNPALYLRDYDPLLSDNNNTDLYLVVGPSDIAKKNKIPLDQYWKYNIKLEKGNREFYDKPFLKAHLTYKADLLGYWNPPFKLFPEDSPIITYTMPFFDSDNRVRGVIGIEISVSYFNKFLPLSDLNSRDSLGYIIGFKGEADRDIHPILMSGALQKRMIHTNEDLVLNEADADKNIYLIENHNSRDNIYACVERIGLYYHNTPFEKEEWYLVGMMSEEHLLSYVMKIKGILWMSLLTSIFIGIVGGYFISYKFTKPIIRLANKVRDSEKDKAIVLESTGLSEVDELSNAMATANNALLESTLKMSRIIDLVDVPIGAFEYQDEIDYVFATDQLCQILSIENDAMRELLRDKLLFIQKLNEILSHPEIEEDGVYIISEYPKKWVKIKTVTNKKSTLGVVIDVTAEIAEKKKIKQERDYDALTKIYNRKAVQRHIEALLQNHKDLKTAAILMFDMDNLKNINDTYGHKWGDVYIKSGVERLDKICETHKVLGRRSGDEFVLFLYGFSNKGTIRRAVKNFYEDLKRDPLTYPDGKIRPITISSGLMWVENSNLTYDELLQHADDALYRAKKFNKGTCCEV